MPHVAQEPADRASRTAAASGRWDALLESRPDLGPAILLQRQLIGVVIDTTEALGRVPLPRLSLPPRYLAAKLSRGTPVLTGEPIPVPTALLQPAFLRICEALADGGAGEAADRIRIAVAGGEIDAASLLTASLSRDQTAIRTGAVHRGLAPDLMWLVAELAVSPVAHELQRSLFATPDPAFRAAADAWSHGYCPACGSWPALAEIVAQRRVFRCSFCSLAWEPPAYACAYCGTGGDAFVTAAPDETRHDRRMEVCGACGGYLKTVDAAVFLPFPLVAIADLETMNMDAAALEHGYQRPPLRELAARR